MAFLHTLLALVVAFVLGTGIGFERQWRQRNAGLRTNVLVAVGAAAFADIGLRLTGTDGAGRIVSYVVSGIGFLGAGVILKDGTNICGLNTAATLWCSAAVGTFSGAGLPTEAAAVTAFILAVANQLSHPGDRIGLGERGRGGTGGRSWCRQPPIPLSWTALSPIWNARR